MNYIDTEHDWFFEIDAVDSTFQTVNMVKDSKILIFQVCIQKILFQVSACVVFLYIE